MTTIITFVIFFIIFFIIFILINKNVMLWTIIFSALLAAVLFLLMKYFKASLNVKIIIPILSISILPIYYMISKHELNWAAMGVLVTILLGAFAIYSNDFLRKYQYTHTDPNIKCKLEYTSELKNGKPFKNTNPTIAITNDGPIKVTSLKIKLKLYAYDMNKNEIGSMAIFQQKEHGYLKFLNSFEPSQSVSESLAGIPMSLIGIYIFSLEYYRETDLAKYETKKIFFTEDGVIYTDKEYKKKSEITYQTIIRAINTFDINKNESLLS